MSRPLRIEFPGAIYHVVARGVSRMRTFDDDDDYLKFLELLGDLVADGALIVLAFCLMPNHPHMLCQTPRGELGRYMELLFGKYARCYNVRHERVGHLWQARYRGLLVESGPYLVDCSRYIHLNPCRDNCLVDAPELWPWSSYPNYVGGISVVPWVSTDLILSDFASRREYRDYVEAGMNEELVSPFERAVGGVAYGGPEFVAKIRLMEERRTHRSEVSGRRALLASEDCPPEDLIRELVDVEFRGSSTCKKSQLLGYLLHRFTWLKNAEIASLLARTPPAVTSARARIAARLPEDRELWRRLARIEKQLKKRAAGRVIRVEGLPPSTFMNA